MHDLPVVPRARHGVFLGSEALAAGWTTSALKHAARCDNLARLDRGVYAPVITGDDHEALRARFVQASVAATLVCRPARASHRSSAVLANLAIWTTPARACVTVPPRFTGDARTAHLHRATLLVSEIVPGEVPRTRVARTITDVAREAGVEEAVVIGDAALHAGMTDLDAIAASVLRCAGWPGFRRAAAVLALLDGRAESPLESVSRLRVLAHGLPTPDVQPTILDRYGRFVARPDLYWDDHGVVGEIDGKVKLKVKPQESAWNWVQRHDRLVSAGLGVVRWGRADIDNMPAIARRFWDAVADQAQRGLPRTWIVQPNDGIAPHRAAG